MPSKYVVRNFTRGGIYHIYNKGIEKKKIFLEEEDYKIFLYYIDIYLRPLKKVLETYPKLPLRLQKHNMSSEVDLFAFCLMPTHFHFLLRQHKDGGISKFMKQITNAYTLYFNTKYKRSGSLFEGRFKSVSVDIDNQLIHISRYIHLDPVTTKLTQNSEDYPWSSYQEYLNDTGKHFAKPRLILSYFSSPQQYKEFVLDQADYTKKLEEINSILLEKGA